MIRRGLALVVIAWALGFLIFAVTLPRPAGAEKTDAIVVPTGSGGRIQRGLALLREGAAERMLVTGVDADVRPREFAAEYDVPARLMECCVTLGFAGDMVLGEKDIDVAVAVTVSPAGVPTNFIFDGASEEGITMADLVALQQRMAKLNDPNAPMIPLRHASMTSSGFSAWM